MATTSARACGACCYAMFFRETFRRFLAGYVSAAGGVEA